MTRKNSEETAVLVEPGTSGETTVVDEPVTSEESSIPDVLDALAAPGEVEEATREIDPRIIDFVNRGQARTEAAPRKWSYVTLPESEVKRVTKDAKQYARETGRVFRIKRSDNPTRLVYRVTAKVTTTAEAGAAQTSE